MSHAEKLKPLRDGFQALFDVCDELDRIVDIEAGAAKAQDRLDSLRTSCEEERAKLQGIVDDIAKARAEAAKWRQDAHDYAVSVRAAADAEVRAATEKAVKASEQTVADAKQAAAASLASVQTANTKAIAKANKELADVEAAIAKAKGDEEAASQAAAKAQAEMGRIDSALMEARARLGIKG